MLVLLLDVVALWAITSFLAKQNMSEEMFRFVVFAAVLILSGALIVFGGAPPALALATWFIVLFFGMKFWIGASWLGSVIGAALFVAYRLLLGLIF